MLQSVYVQSRSVTDRDFLQAGDRVLLVDDLIATGGTAVAGMELVEALGAEIYEVCSSFHISTAFRVCSVAGMELVVVLGAEIHEV